MKVRPLFITLLMIAFSAYSYADEIRVPYSNSLSLSSMTEAVYQQLPERLAEADYLQLKNATESLSQALFAEPVTVNLMHFNDSLIGSDTGFQDWEGSVDLPIWLTGQRTAQQQLANKIFAELPAYQNELKLTASALVRQAIWQVKSAEVNLEEIELNLLTAEKLEEEVVSRVKAGELASTEVLLAQSHRLGIESQLIEAQSILAEQFKLYILITGQSALPLEYSEKLAENQNLNSHPSLLLQAQRIERARAETSLAQFDNVINPSVSLGFKRERGDANEDFNHSLGVGFTVPLGNKQYQKPAIAMASAKLTEAEIAQQQLKKQLIAILVNAQEKLAGQQKRLKLMTEKDVITQQYYTLQKRAFDLGEINLINLLNSRVLADKSRAEMHRLQLQIQQSIADINQAYGVIL